MLRSQGSRRLAVVAALGFAITLLAVAPSRVHGCSCADYEHWGFLGPLDGRLPANAAGVLWFKPKVHDWRRGGLQAPPSERKVRKRILVERWTGERFERVAASARSVDGFPGIFVIAPRQGFAVDVTYQFTDLGSILDDEDPGAAHHDRQFGSGPYRQIHVTMDAETLPANARFDLRVEPVATSPILVAADDTCSYRGPPVPHAHATIEAEMDVEMLKWRGQLLFRALIDDEPWVGAASLCSLHPSGRSWRPVGHDTIYSTCGIPDDKGGAPIAFREPRGAIRVLTPETHRVRMQAVLPGAGIVLETETLTVDLSCAKQPDGLPGACATECSEASGGKARVGASRSVASSWEADGMGRNSESARRFGALDLPPPLEPPPER